MTVYRYYDVIAFKSCIQISTVYGKPGFSGFFFSCSNFGKLRQTDIKIVVAGSLEKNWDKKYKFSCPILQQLEVKTPENPGHIHFWEIVIHNVHLENIANLTEPQKR